MTHHGALGECFPPRLMRRLHFLEGGGTIPWMGLVNRGWSLPVERRTIVDHLNDAGYQLFARSMFAALFDTAPPTVNEVLRKTVIDKNRQFFRRYRPANTFYYAGGRNKQYGYLDFLPAMKNFDVMTANRERRGGAVIFTLPVCSILMPNKTSRIPCGLDVTTTEEERGRKEM